eukprot:1782216-Amphidinium_carterae.3
MMVVSMKSGSDFLFWRPGCGRSTWNGKPGEYCSKRCRDEKDDVLMLEEEQPLLARVLSTQCGTPTFQAGQAGSSCNLLLDCLRTLQLHLCTVAGWCPV